MVRLRQRRGAITVMTGLMFLALVTCGALAIDFSRLWTIRSELQTSADAAAIAGTLQYVGGRDSSWQTVYDTAFSYARRNRTMLDTIHVDSIENGNWNPVAKSFTAGANPFNAVNVVVSYNPSQLLMRAFGATIPRMKARAVGWAEAPVAETGCVRPWAIPYEHLMFAINTYRGITNTNANVNRPFDQVADLAALHAMSAAERTFNLKVAQNNNTHNGEVNQTAADATNMPGNYQAVRLGKYWDYATQSVANPGPEQGGNEYADWINGTNGCAGIAVGDSLQTETGNKVGPTINNVSPAICSSITNTPATLATHGDCNTTVAGVPTVGVDIITAFYACGSGCSGQSTVSVKLLGSFTLMKMYPNNDGGPNPQYDRSQIVGVFKPMQAGGQAGGGHTTLQKVVLAK